MTRTKTAPTDRARSRKKNGKSSTGKSLSPEAEKDQLYVAMVAAVREWIAVEFPNAMKDRVDLTLFDSSGCGDTLATFHRDVEDEYVFGDMRAMGK